jgi:hypothetical protein
VFGHGRCDGHARTRISDLSTPGLNQAVHKPFDPKWYNFPQYLGFALVNDTHELFELTLLTIDDVTVREAPRAALAEVERASAKRCSTPAKPSSWRRPASGCCS